MNMVKFFVSIFTVSLFFSCSTDPVYSCDNEIDVWVKEHMSDIKEMNRQEWKTLDPQYAIAVYRAFTPEQKNTFWKEKISEVKRLNWTDAEIKHISKVESFIDTNGEIFSNEVRTLEEEDKIELFFFQWSEYGKNTFGWTDEVVFSIVGTGFSARDTRGNSSIINIQPGDRIIGNGRDCDCSTKSDWCSAGWECKSSDNCDGTSHGCGWVWTYSCNGECD